MAFTTVAVGKLTERIAKNYLKKQGLRWLQSNYHCPFGELDLIFKDGNELVFVEVRYRRNDDFGGAAESITANKRNKLRKAAEHFMQMQTDLAYNGCRFDAVLMHGSAVRPDINWINNAF